MFCIIMKLFKSGDTGGGGDREMLIEQCAAGSCHIRRERSYFIGEAEWGGGGEGGALLAWPPQQLPVHSSQRKFIILFGNM